jgi:hypothetical protein
MIVRLAALTLALAFAFAGSVLQTPGAARAEIDVRSETAQNRFPNGIQFTVFMAGSAEITEVRLRFRIMPDGVNATVRPQCTTGASVTCNATVGNSAQTYMVPGAEIVYSWEVTDATGARFDTPEQRTTYRDDRFQWESISEGNLTVYYYFGDAQSQQTVLRTARETINDIGRLMNARVDHRVKVWVYRTAAEMQPAVASRRGQGPNTSVQTLGEVGASDTALVSRDTDFLNIVRHEVAHIVTRAATRNHIADIPIWINEGISSYAQSDLLPSEAQALRTAIQRNRVLPITSLGASARGAAEVVSLFYAQSGSIVTYLVETHGEEKFAQFIAALASDTTEGALKKVYDFDLLGLENNWRRAIGLPEVGAGGAAPGTTPQPTLVPFGGQQTNPTPSSGNEQRQTNPTPTGDRSSPAATGSGGGVSLLVVAGGLGAVVVLLLAAAGGLYLQSRRKLES